MDATQETSLFRSADKATFRRLYRGTQARLFRRNVMVAATVYVAFICWDVVVAPESLKETFEIRAFFFGASILLFVGSGLSGFGRFYNWFYVALLTSAALGVAVILSIVPGGFTFGIPGILLCITASSALFGNVGWTTAVAGTLVTLGTLGLMGFQGEPEYLIRSTAIFLVTAVGFSVLHSVQAERSAFAVYSAQEHLRDEKTRTQALLADITAMREERLTWLENLARFLRHELKNQIVAVGTSIDLAQHGESLDANRVYLERAQRSLGRMRGLVSSATEATSLEAALAADEVETVDLSALVADRVLTFQQLHPSRQLVLRPKPGLFVDGSEERLAQLLDKLLSNAVEHSAAESEIRVTLRRAGDEWFELSVENEGDPLPPDAERIFEAFVTSQGRPENLGLGLFVAQSIARNHKGHIRAHRLPDAQGARFVVRLPETGAGQVALREGEARGIAAAPREGETARRD